MSQQVYGEENAFGEADRLSKGTTAAVAVHKRAMAEIQGEISTTTSTIQALKAEEAKLSEKIASVAAEEKRTAIQIARADDARTATVPRVKYVSLCASIFKLA